MDENAPSSTVDPSVQCVRCRYDLRGLNVGGRCPECGLKTHWSLLAPQNLSQYPAWWVNRMAWATRILMLVYLAVAVAIFAGIREQFDSSRITLPMILLVISAAHCLGIWLLSTSSGHWSEPSGRWNRRVLRAAAIAPMITFAIILWMMSQGRVIVVLDFAGAAAGFVGLFGPPAIFIRLRAVARMIADESLAEHSGIVGWGFVIVLFVVPALTYVIALCGYGGYVGLLLVLIVSVGGTLFILWATFILLSCVIDFGRAATIASAQWKIDAPDL